MNAKKSLLTKPLNVRSPQPRMEEPHVAYEDCRRHRDAVAPRYDEATSYAFPGRQGLTTDPDAYQAYDDTASVATPEFASRIQAGVCPNFSRWASHIAGHMVEDEDEKKELIAALQPVDEYMFDIINSSNFQIEVFECFLDLALGTMAMEVEERDETNPIHCQAVPLRQLYFSLGPDNMPDPIARVRKLTKRLIRSVYPMAADFETQDERAEHTIVEIWQRDWTEPNAHRYRCTIFLPDKSNLVLHQYDVDGIGSCKYIVTRWSKSSGEVWGRGPLVNVLPSMRLVNFAMSSVIDHADIALAGIWSAEDDGVLNTETVKLEPGVIVPRAPGSRPLENVAPQGRFDIAQFLIEEHRSNIKKALYTEQLGNPNKTPFTAAEVDQRMAELARAIGAPFGRIVLEFVMPFIGRVVKILKDRKLIVLPEVDGKEIKRIATSPLSQSQRFEDIDRSTKYIGTITQLFGPETAAMVVDATEASLYLGERFGVPERINRDRKKQTELAAKIAQAQAGGMGGGQPGQEAGAGAPQLGPEAGLPA